MIQNRRTFVRTTSLGALAAGAHRLLPEFVIRHLDPITGDPDPALRELAMQALSAATAAGAGYADVRFSLAQSRGFVVAGIGNVGQADTEYDVGVGVRALVNGRWGFVAGAGWSGDEVVRLARGAVAKARAADWGQVAGLELAPTPAVTGRWTTPIERDPLEVPPAETIAHINDAHQVAIRLAGKALVGVVTEIRAERVDKTFASTDGSFLQQRLYTMFSGGSHSLLAVNTADGSSGSGASALHVWPMSGGYELLAAAGLKEQIPGMVEAAIRGLNAVRGDVGRYDVVLHPQATAELLATTIGRATQLNRAIGLEANASGTSFLAPPEAILDRFQLGTPAFTVTAERTSVHGAATVAWDDEGVAPDGFTLVDRGMAVDYQTDRERAPELAAHYRSRHQAVRSHACAVAGSAHDVVRIQTPNLTMHSATGTSSGTFEDLVRDVQDGYAVLGGQANLDQQVLGGQMVVGGGFRIRKGKLAEPVSGMSVLFRTPELWRSVTETGNVASALTVGMGDEHVFSVTAVPVRVRNLRVISDARTL